MASIHFGNIIKEGNKTVVNDATGIGLDTQALIKSELAPKEQKLKEAKDTIEKNVKKLAAFSELRTKLNTIKNTTDNLRFDTLNNPLLSNSFDSKTATIKSSDGLASNNYIEIVPTDQCPISKHNITITNLASANKAVSDRFTSNTSSITGVGAGYFGVGSFLLNNIPITITNGDNLVNIASKINLVQQKSNTQAYVMQVSNSDYRLVLQSTKTGIINSFTISDSGGIWNNINLNYSPANDANITFNNISITNPSNIIDNVVNGLTLNLINPTPSGVTINCDIESDPQAITSILEQLQSAYNDFIGFFAQQTAKKEGDLLNFDEKAILAKENILYTVNNSIRSILTNPVTNLSQNQYTSLASIGITILSSNAPSMKNVNKFNLTHEMQIDYYKLNPILATNFEAVKSIFSVKFYATSPAFGLLKTPQNLNINNFSLNVDTSRIDSNIDGKVRATYTINGVTSTILPQYQFLSNNVGGSNDIKIVGVQGTPLGGLEMIFRDNGTGVGQTNITLTQGIGDKISNFLQNVLDNDIGTLQQVEKTLVNNNTTQQDKVRKQEVTINEEREKLLNKYALLQNKVAAYNKQLASMKAWDAAQKNNK